ncbi:MAG: hypothetical protein LBN19_00130 [Endomicrobium sp.]|nr:hypothetical protein [Endomicrobium sp.]
MPQFTARYSRSVIDSYEIERLEDKEILSGTMIYNNPLEFMLLPTNISAEARTANSYYKVYPSVPVARSYSFLGLDRIKEYLNIAQYRTLERSNIFVVKFLFKFFHGVTFSSSYIINSVREKKNDFIRKIEFDKVLNQTVGISLLVELTS